MKKFNAKYLIYLVIFLVCLGVLIYGFCLYKKQSHLKPYPVKPIVLRNLEEKEEFLFKNCQLPFETVKYAVCKYGLDDRLIYPIDSLKSSDEIGLRIGLDRINLKENSYLCLETSLLNSEKVKTPSMALQYIDQTKNIYRACSEKTKLESNDLFVFGVVPFTNDTNFSFKIYALKVKPDQALLEKGFKNEDFIFGGQTNPIIIK